MPRNLRYSVLVTATTIHVLLLVLMVGLMLFHLLIKQAILMFIFLH